MAIITTFRVLIAAIIVGTISAFIRALYILPSKSHAKPDLNCPRKLLSHVVVVLGSGGHTAEMTSLLRDLNPRRYFHRTYVVSSGDAFSAKKASEIERSIQAQYRDPNEEATMAGTLDQVVGRWDVRSVPRARRIHQPLYTAPFSSLRCLIGCILSLKDIATNSTIKSGNYPDLIITNGPATAVMFILASFVLKFFAVAPAWTMKVIYVESWARVKSLSLSGALLLRLGLCDKFLVQWEILAVSINKGGKKRVDWIGFLVE